MTNLGFAAKFTASKFMKTNITIFLEKTEVSGVAVKRL